MNITRTTPINISILLAFLLLPGFLIAQSKECGTEYDGYVNTEAISNAKKMKDFRPKNKRQFLVSFHVVRNNNGFGGANFEECYAALQKVNEHYADAGIEFTTCQYVHDINNSNYLTTYKNNYDELLKFSYQRNTINVYVVNLLRDSDDDPLCGIGTFPRPDNINSRAIIIKRECMNNGSTLSHEFGHYFDLKHTHDTYSGIELVNRSNCSTSGDGFCDTPADPKLSNSTVSNNCIYTGDDRDPTGAIYQPDVTNLMSYSRKECRFVLSDQQSNYVRAIGESEHPHLFAVCPEQDVIVSTTQILDRNLNGQTITINYILDCATLEQDEEVNMILMLRNNSSGYIYTLLNRNILLRNGYSDTEYLDIAIPFNLSTGKYELELLVDSEFTLSEKSRSNNSARWDLEINNNHLNDLHIFPNPVQDKIRVFNRSYFEGFIDILMFDANGQLIDQFQKRKRGLEFGHIIDVSAYNPGIYFISLQAEEMEKVIYRFVKL
ncbi:MAG: zinc-dependent metalloprotease [Bacteroidia bacterium]|nr:zinc-dependent metalloprotease [Bacteroidia bacterium]